MKATSTYADGVQGLRLHRRTPRALELSARLNDRLGTGVLAFPLTAFSSDGEELNLSGFRRHIRRHIDHGAAALFIACGTGEFSALDEVEYSQVLEAAVAEANGELPVLSGIGYGWAQARRFAKISEDVGVDGALVLPHYLVRAPQAGSVAHFRKIAEATELPLMVYQRGLLQLEAETLAAIAEIPTVIGLKDGHGDLVTMHEMTLSMPSDFLFFNGALTAEVQHRLYSSIGVRAYSSAFHSCAPEVAHTFFHAHARGEKELTDQLLREVYFPFIALRNQVPGYAVSLIKATARLRGEDVGPVRAPLEDPPAEHLRRLEAIMRRGLDLVGARF